MYMNNVMRKIRFRGLSKSGLSEDGKWLYGLPMKDGDDWYIVSDFERQVHCVCESITMPAAVDIDRKVDPKTIGQSTELKDQKGIEIYDGDVIFTNGHGQDEYHTISWDKENACFGAHNWLFFKNPKPVEVIGNIHELDKLPKEARDYLTL